MKKLLLIIFLSTPLFAEVKMTPLKEYLKTPISDPNSLLYVISRCSAINFNLAGISDNTADISDNTKELQDEGLLRGEKLSQMARTLRKIIRKELPSADNKIANNKRINENAINLIFNEYEKIMNENYAKTGMYLTDMMIDDLSTCSVLYEQSIDE